MIYHKMGHSFGKYGVLLSLMLIVVFLSGCAESNTDTHLTPTTNTSIPETPQEQQQTSITPTTNTSPPEAPQKQEPNIRAVLKDEIDSVGGMGMPKATSILYQNRELYVEYTTWEILTPADTFDEQQKITGLVKESFVNETEKPTKTTFKVLSANDNPAWPQSSTTTLTWEQLEKMANLELSYSTWQGLTVRVE